MLRCDPAGWDVEGADAEDVDGHCFYRTHDGYRFPGEHDWEGMQGTILIVQLAPHTAAPEQTQICQRSNPPRQAPRVFLCFHAVLKCRLAHNCAF